MSLLTLKITFPPQLRLLSVSIQNLHIALTMAFLINPPDKSSPQFEVPNYSFSTYNIV